MWDAGMQNLTIESKEDEVSAVDLNRIGKLQWRSKQKVNSTQLQELGKKFKSSEAQWDWKISLGLNSFLDKNRE